MVFQLFRRGMVQEVVSTAVIDQNPQTPILDHSLNFHSGAV